MEHPGKVPAAHFESNVFGGCLLALSDFNDAVSQEPRTRRFVQLALGAGLCAGAAGVFMLTRQHTKQGLVLLALGVLASLAYNAPEQVAERWFAKTPPQARLVKFTLNSQGLVLVSEVSKQFHAWADLQGLDEGPSTFLVWVDEKRFVVIPKRAFVAADLPRAGELLRSRLGDKPSPVRPWLPLWAALLFGLALLALWNWLWPR